MHSTYLYGIIEERGGATPEVTGVDGVSPVHIVPCEGLGGVVSSYRGPELEAMPRDKLVRSLLAHQWVVEQVMKLHTVLPVKFGTLLNGADEVRAVLSQGHPGFVTALAALRDKVEIEVAAVWDINRVLEEIASNEEVARTRQAIAARGRASVEDSVHLGQLVKAVMDQRREGYRSGMVRYLTPLSVDVASNAIVSDEMVMNVAFLVERRREKEFYRGVEHLDNLHRGQISFRIIGPLPSYSFSTVEVTPLSPAQVEAARQTLNLGAAVSEVEVRKAYRRLCAEQHRGLRPGDGESLERSSGLKRAADLLLGYCRARRDAGCGAANLFRITTRGLREEEVQASRFGATVLAGRGGA